MKQIKEQMKILPRPDKVSVRTTCKLTNAGDEALTWLTKEYGITMKEVFDAICESIGLKADINEDSIIYMAIEAVKKVPQEEICSSARKTLVTSKRSLNLLNIIAKKTKTPRDLLIDRGVVLLADLCKRNIQEDRIRAEKILNDDIRPVLEMFDQRLANALKTLNDDYQHPIVNRLHSAMQIVEFLKDELTRYVKQGTPISENLFEFEVTVGGIINEKPSVKKGSRKRN